MRARALDPRTWSAGRAEGFRLALVLGIIATAYAAVGIRNHVLLHDEGLVLQAAARIESGGWPYRDFWWNYGPGQPALLAALSSITGPSLLTWRVLRVIIDVACAMLAFRLTREHAGGWWAVAAWAATLGLMASARLPHPNATVALLTLAAVAVVPRHPALGAIAAGLTGVFRPELAPAAIAGVVIAGPTGQRTRIALIGSATLVISLVPSAVVAGPVELLQSTFGFGLTHQRLQRLPLALEYRGAFDPLAVLLFYLPAGLLAATLVTTTAAALTNRSLQLLALLPMTLAGAAYLLARADQFHFVPLAATLPILMATTAAKLAAERRLAAVALGGLLLVTVAATWWNRGEVLLRPPPVAPLGLAGAGSIRVTPQDVGALRGLEAQLARHSPRGAPIFIGNARHDRVRSGATLLYVLLRRPNATRYDVIQPGVITAADVQREITGDLCRTRAVVVQYAAPVANMPESNRAGRSSGVVILDRFLTRHYRRAWAGGDYRLLVPRPNLRCAPA